jgi:hypothetical protein
MTDGDEIASGCARGAGCGDACARGGSVGEVTGVRAVVLLLLLLLDAAVPTRHTTLAHCAHVAYTRT